jgi:hypothetical protein
VRDHDAGRPQRVVRKHFRVLHLDGGGEEAEVVAEVLLAVAPAALAVAGLQLGPQAVERGDGRLG